MSAASDDAIAVLGSTIRELEEQVATKTSTIAAYEAAIVELQARIVALEAEPEPTPEPVPAPVVAWREDFSTGDPVSGWNPNNDRGKANRSYVTSGLPGITGRALQVFASKNNDGLTGYGTQTRVALSKLGVTPSRDKTLAFDVLLPANWNPYAGGKWPGLGCAPTPAQLPGGGELPPDGIWSGRTMWLRSLDGNLDHGRVTSYLYVPHAAGTDLANNRNVDNGRIYGIEVIGKNDDGEPAYLIRGRKHRVEQRYVMNTPGKTDGKFQVRLDGELVVDITDVRYSTAGDPPNSLMFDSFYGGPTANITDQVWGFDNVEILTA